MLEGVFTESTCIEVCEILEGKVIAPMIPTKKFGKVDDKGSMVVDTLCFLLYIY